MLRDIVDIRLKELQDKLDDRRITLKVDDAAKDWLAERGYDLKYGARPLNRLIMRKVAKVLAERLITGEIKTGMTAKVQLAGGGEELVLVGEMPEGEGREVPNESI